MLCTKTATSNGSKMRSRTIWLHSARFAGQLSMRTVTSWSTTTTPQSKPRSPSKKYYLGLWFKRPQNLTRLWFRNVRWYRPQHKNCNKQSQSNLRIKAVKSSTQSTILRCLSSNQRYKDSQPSHYKATKKLLCQVPTSMMIKSDLNCNTYDDNVFLSRKASH